MTPVVGLPCESIRWYRTIASELGEPSSVEWGQGEDSIGRVDQSFALRFLDVRTSPNVGELAAGTWRPWRRVEFGCRPEPSKRMLRILEQNQH